MEKYTLEELKEAWVKLFWTKSDAIWRDVNMELARRMTSEEFADFRYSH